MIQTVITHYNSILSSMPFFSNVYGLAELKTDNTMKQPVIRVGNKLERIKLNTAGTTYFRKRQDVSINQSESQVSCDTVYQFTIPLRLLATTKRNTFPSNTAYSSEQLSATLIKALSFKNGQLKNDIGAVSIVSSASLYSTDTQKIISEEYTGNNRDDFNHEDIVVAINIDLIINTYQNCIEDVCDYIPRFCLQLESYVALP